MAIEFTCTGCQAPQRASEHLAGRKLRCQKCGASFVVPVGGKSPAAAKPAGAAGPGGPEEAEWDYTDDASDSIFGK